MLMKFMICSNLPQYNVLKCISFILVMRDSIHHDPIKNACSQIYQQSILERYYDIPDFSIFSETYHLYDQPIATQAYCFLLDFIFSHNANLVKNLSEPFTENIDNSLLLANHSLCQLNILNVGKFKGQLSSILNLLNKTKTPYGETKI